MRSRTGARILTALLVVGLFWLAPPAHGDWSFETLDGDGGPNGQVTTSVGVHNTVLLYGGQPHVWYQDWDQATLRHAWWTGTAWFFETLDGNGGPNGRVNDSVGQWSSAVLYGGKPHVFYMQGFDPVVDAKLRHAWWTGTTWYFETLDGNGGLNGRTGADVGAHTSAVLYFGTPHVWYHDEDDATLRHAWWTGAAWWFETLDGNGGPNGRVATPVGEYTTALVYGGGPHVWYSEFFTQAMRHAWWTGSMWMFETLDGQGGVWGGTTNDVGTWRTAALYGGAPHVYYRDDDADALRHAWWTGSSWWFEVLDGVGGPNGRTTHDVGTYPSVVEYAGGPHVFYADNDDEALRHGWWNGVTWWFETLDGNGGPAGQTSFAAGGWTAALLYGGQPHVWYTEAAFSMLNLRHAWWTPTVGVSVWFVDMDRFVSPGYDYMVPVPRSVPAFDPVHGAMTALFAGPTPAEQAQNLALELSGATGFTDLSVSGGIARVRLLGGCDSQGSTLTIANHIAPTLKQFPQVQYVKIYDPAGTTGSPTGASDSIPTCLEP